MENLKYIKVVINDGDHLFFEGDTIEDADSSEHVYAVFLKDGRCFSFMAHSIKYVEFKVEEV